MRISVKNSAICNSTSMKLQKIHPWAEIQYIAEIDVAIPLDTQDQKAESWNLYFWLIYSLSVLQAVHRDVSSRAVNCRTYSCDCHAICHQRPHEVLNVKFENTNQTKFM